MAARVLSFRPRSRSAALCRIFRRFLGHPNLPKTPLSGPTSKLEPRPGGGKARIGAVRSEAEGNQLRQDGAERGTGSTPNSVDAAPSDRVATSGATGQGRPQDSSLGRGASGAMAEHSQPSALADLGMSLSTWCARRRVSQSALAMRVGVSASHLNQIARGRARPSSELAQRILAVIGRIPQERRSPDPLDVASTPSR